MHELSIIQSILDTTLAAVQEQGNQRPVEAIELQIGDLAGIELRTLQFLWPAAVGDTLLADAVLDIERIPGRAQCSDCGAVFTLHSFFEPCPDCGSHLLSITDGEEMKIKAIVLGDGPTQAISPVNWN